jgi:hypothetical protein
MPRDLYMRDKTDPFYQDDILEVNDELQMLIGQLKMLLFTNQGEVLGAPDFGANLEEQLFSLNLNEFSIKSTLRDQVLKFIPLNTKYQVDFSVKFSRGTSRDICIIDVLINNIPAFGVIVK